METFELEDISIHRHELYENYHSCLRQSDVVQIQWQNQHIRVETCIALFDHP